MDNPHVLHLIDGYVDGEIDPVRSGEIERHISGCAVCRRSYDSRRSLHALVGGAATYYRAPAGLEARILAGIGERPAERGAARQPSREWMRLAASTLIAALFGGALTYWSVVPDPDAVLVHEVVAGHVRALLGEGRLVDVASSDEHTVRPWLDNRLDYAPPVVDFTAEGYPLVGGRLDFLNARPVAALVYQHRKHVIQLFVWPAEHGARHEARAQTERGLNVLRWSDGAMNYWIVSDVNAKELADLAKMIQAGATPKPAS